MYVPGAKAGVPDGPYWSTYPVLYCCVLPLGGSGMSVTVAPVAGALLSAPATPITLPPRVLTTIEIGAGESPGPTSKPSPNTSKFATLADLMYASSDAPEISMSQR